MCGFVLIITAILAFLVVPGLADGNTSRAVFIGTLVFVIVAAICAVFAGLAAKVYWNNIWVLTSESLTQVNQDGLFNRQSSQISLPDVEDVTAEQKGVLAELFNFGLLEVETAGETGKFVFPYCPKPNYYAQQVLKAKEEFEHKRYSGEQTAEIAQQTVPLEPAPPIPPPVVNPATELPRNDVPLQQPPPGPGAEE